MRVLIIEDDRQLAKEMKTGLERQGFTVDNPISSSMANNILTTIIFRVRKTVCRIQLPL